jgi:DNA-binding transcriptional MerR regulator
VGLTFEAGLRLSVGRMTTFRIAEVAERTGVPATTLRYYEDIGLLAPAGRKPNGYRAYSERDVERLRFITRAKQLDLTLDDLRDLVTAWDAENCGDVQDRMARVVTDRLEQTQTRLADLMALAAQLQAAAARLATAEKHAGPCSDGCACATAASHAGAAPAEPTFVPLTRRPADVPAGAAAAVGAGELVGCTLDAGRMKGRVEDWQALLSRAVGREPIPGGTALVFDHDAGLTVELARLAAAEHGCCSFFDFTLALTGEGLRLEVRGPAEAHEVIAAIFGPVGTTA